jgi:hypothetical protein
MSGWRPSRTALAAFALTLAGACSLLVSSGLNGHPCGPNDTCLPGYYCNAEGICDVHGDCAAPGCPNGQKCVRQQCVGICEGLACPPATVCGTNTCQPVTTTGATGSPCMADSDCLTGLFCLSPYTGGAAGTGVCTIGCTKLPVDSCAEAGAVCTTFPSDTPTEGESGIDLCAPPGLTPCTSDGVCSSSGLVCTVLYGNASSSVASASACGTPIASGGAAATACSNAPPVAPCSSGLCVDGTLGRDAYCTTPCGSESDCTTAFGSTSACTYVTIAESGGTPRTRAQVCVLSGSSLGQPCGNTQGQNCTADAPFCVPALPTTPPDAGSAPDAGAIDSGAPDGGTSSDTDAGSDDAGATDAGTVDAGVTTSPTDAGMICAPYCTNGTTPCPLAGMTQLSCDTTTGDPNIGICR